MSLPIKLVSTDFDGTIFAEFENPPISKNFEFLIADLQSRGVKWVINTGRDMSSLMEALARAKISAQPDFLVLVEREIYVHDGVAYAGLKEWNRACSMQHAELFSRLRADLPKLTAWVNERFRAMVYEDPYSPFCLIAGSNGDADVIHRFMEDYAAKIPNLTVVRNDVYARFSHAAFNKGTALAELTKRLNLDASQVFAVGDHLNDLPMLSNAYAKWLAAPSNAVPEVKAAVLKQNGRISKFSHGEGVVESIEVILAGQK